MPSSTSNAPRPPDPQKQERFGELLYFVLAAVFIASLVACNLIFQKFFYWEPLGPDGYRFELSVGILPYPITFLVTDILSELYGKRRADQVVVSGLLASVFVTGVVWVASLVPATSWSPVSGETFNTVFGLTPAAVLASMLAYLTAQFIDIRVFHFWRRFTRGKHLWLRNNGSTIVSQLVDTSVVLAVLCLAPSVESVTWERFPSLLLNGFLFKTLVALADTPLFYLAVHALRGRVPPPPENW